MLERDDEAGLLRSRTVIGEVEALPNQRVDVDGPTFAGTLTRVQQHVLDDGVSPLAVLDHLVEVILEQASQFIDFGADFVDKSCLFQHVIEFIGQLDRERREIVDEIQRVLDLVRDARGKLAERSELLGLDQAVLRRAQIVE